MVRGIGPGGVPKRLRAFLQRHQPKKIVAAAHGVRVRHAVQVRVSHLHKAFHQKVQHENARRAHTQHEHLTGWIVLNSYRTTFNSSQLMLLLLFFFFLFFFIVIFIFVLF